MSGGLHPPASVIASWKPNYINPETHGEQIIVVEILFLVLCFITVAVRVYTRLVLSKTFGWDDGLIIFNLLPLTGMAVSLCLAFTRYGWNRHIWDIPLNMKYEGRKVALAIQLTYLLSSCTTKISILLFYRRLVVRVLTLYTWAIYACIAVVAGYCLAGCIALLTGCQPFHAYWHEMSPHWVAKNQGKYWCYDEAAHIVAITAISMATDFAVCILPMPLVIKLNMSTRKKVQSTAIFSFGLFLCICGLLRLVAVVRNYYGSYDHTWASEQAWLWTGIEAHLGVILASVPAINYFFRKHPGESSAFTRFGALSMERLNHIWRVRRHSRGSQHDLCQHAHLEDGRSDGMIPQHFIRVTQHFHVDSARPSNTHEMCDTELRDLRSSPTPKGVSYDPRNTKGSAWFEEDTSEDETSGKERVGLAL